MQLTVVNVVVIGPMRWMANIDMGNAREVRGEWRGSGHIHRDKTHHGIPKIGTQEAIAISKALFSNTQGREENPEEARTRTRSRDRDSLKSKYLKWSSNGQTATSGSSTSQQNKSFTRWLPWRRTRRASRPICCTRTTRRSPIRISPKSCLPGSTCFPHQSPQCLAPACHGQCGPSHTSCQTGPGRLGGLQEAGEGDRAGVGARETPRCWSSPATRARRDWIPDSPSRRAWTTCSRLWSLSVKEDTAAEVNVAKKPRIDLPEGLGEEGFFMKPGQ